VTLLFVSGCGASPDYVATGLQPNNCGTPYQFKRCNSSSIFSAARPQRPVVVVQELNGPAQETPTPGPDDLISYSKLLTTR
jgi:hypothetical protein